MNYYKLMKLSPKASSKDINDTHRTLAKKYHPDINNNEDAHEKMTKLNEAYEVLSDKNKRKEYDKKLISDLQQQQRQHISTGVSRTGKSGLRHETAFDSKRTDKAELLRKKAEERLKTEEAQRVFRTEMAQKRAEEAARKKRHDEVMSDKKKVIDVLSYLATSNDFKLRKKEETKDDLQNAVKVLLSLVKGNGAHMQKMAEENERKQRIKEILDLIHKGDEEKTVE